MEEKFFEAAVAEGAVRPRAVGASAGKGTVNWSITTGGAACAPYIAVCGALTDEPDRREQQDERLLYAFSPSIQMSHCRLPPFE